MTTFGSSSSEIAIVHADLALPLDNLGRLGVNRSADDVAVPVSYVTREDLQQYDENLILMLSQLLNAYAQKRDREITEGFQTFYSQVAERQDLDYQQLSGRIDVLGRELLLELDRSARGFQEILSGQPQNARIPGNEEE